MHERDVDNWNYSTEVQRNGSSEMQCAVVSYNTYVESPTFFARLLRNFHMSLEFPIVVHKQVCVSGHTVVEASTVAVPLINEFSMTARYEVDPDEINATVTAHYQVPWYLEFLVHDIGHHLRHNFKLKLEAVARSLCARTAAFPTLSAPAKQYVLQAFRRHAAKYPLHAPAPLQRPFK